MARAEIHKVLTGSAIASAQLAANAESPMTANQPDVAAIAWQPIETFPTDAKWALATMVLCAHDQKRWMRFGRYYGELKRWYYSGTNERSQWAQVAGDAPTHFALMPELPPLSSSTVQERKG